jgi:predicted enzyme involved in methoxymalonyl-ACP biosynthesis
MVIAELRKEIDQAIAVGDLTGASRMLREVWNQEAPAGVAGFVASRFDRIREPLGLTACRFAILRSFTVEPVIPILRAMGYANGIAIDVHVGEFNAYAQEILDPESALYRFGPQVAVLAVQTRDVAPDLWRGEGSGAGVLERYEGWIAGFRRQSDAALIVHSLEVPEAASGILDGQQEQSQAEAVRAINCGLRALTRKHRGVYVLDYDGLVARHGRLGWGEER